LSTNTANNELGRRSDEKEPKRKAHASSPPKRKDKRSSTKKEDNLIETKKKNQKKSRHLRLDYLSKYLQKHPNLHVRQPTSQKLKTLRSIDKEKISLKLRRHLLNRYTDSVEMSPKHRQLKVKTRIG